MASLRDRQSTHSRRATHWRGRSAAATYRRRPAHRCVDGGSGAGPRRRRPAAQQPAAVPDVLLLHRAAGRVPAARLTQSDALVGPDAALTLRPTARRQAVSLEGLRQHARRELAAVAWTDEQKAAFVRCSSRPRPSTTGEHYPGTSFDVILSTAQPAGRLYVARWTDEIRIVDIALLPEFCNRGIGTTLLRQLQAEARRGRQAAAHPRRALQSRRCGSTSGSGSGRSRIAASICSWNGEMYDRTTEDAEGRRENGDLSCR